MLRSALVLASFVGFCATASAQCSTLAITGTGAPGTNLAVALDGNSAGAFAFLVIGEQQGTLSINLGPLGTLDLGIAAPSLILPLGMADAQGDVSSSIPVPANLPSTVSVDVFGQAVSLGITLTTPPPTFTLCASNVVGFHVGS